MDIKNLLLQIEARAKEKDALFVAQKFDSFLAEVLTIDGHDVLGTVAGIGNTSFTYQQFFSILQQSIIAARESYAADAARTRIENVILETLKN